MAGSSATTSEPQTLLVNNPNVSAWRCPHWQQSACPRQCDGAFRPINACASDVARRAEVLAGWSAHGGRCGQVTRCAWKLQPSTGLVVMAASLKSELFGVIFLTHLIHTGLCQRPGGASGQVLRCYVAQRLDQGRNVLETRGAQSSSPPTKTDQQ
jgi:hypothetical protein